MQAAPLPARLLKRLESWGVPRLDSRRVINLSLAVLSALVVVLAAHTSWHSLHAYRQAKQVEQVDGATNDFVAAAGLLELELTYGSALLGAERLDPDRLKRLHRVRHQGDLLWRRAMSRARSIAAHSGIREDLLARHARAMTSFEALGGARRQLEGCLQRRGCALTEDAWEQAVDRVVEDSAAAREAVYYSVDSPERPARLYAAVQRSAWLLTEYTRRESGLMAFYLSGDQALTAAARAELTSEHAVAREAQDNLRVYTKLHRLDAHVRSAIEAADRSLTRRFTPLMLGVVGGQFHPHGQAWLADTAPTFAALDHLSATVEHAVSTLAAQAMRESRNDMLFNGLFALLACSVAALSATKVRQTANALFHRKELAEVIIRSIGDAVITTDDHGRVEYVNPAAQRLTGWRSPEARGLPLECVFEVLNGATLERQMSPVEVCLRENRVVSLDDGTVLVHRDGTHRHIEDSAAPIRDRAGHLTGAVLVFYDATEVQQGEHLISYRATHDALTGLINRREFERRLAALLAHRGDDSTRHALLFLDIDHFTIINESCGHLAGDHLLREVSRTLARRARPGDVLARLGGDEFGLIVSDGAPEQARDIAESLRAEVAGLRFDWQGCHFQPRLSVGLVPFGLDADEPAAILGRAEAACHLAKEKGRDRLQVYDRGEREFELRSGGLRWMARLNEALAQDRFTLYCQPVVSVSGRGPRRGEVLARMLDPQGKVILASHFIPQAERYGFMPRLDRWVVHKTLATLGALYTEGRGERAGMLAINLSGATLSDRSLAQFIQEEMRVCGVPPGALCFEITETAAVSSLSETAALINTLRRLGCAFALDDFGRGMSSFMYLKQLPVDYLKIDGAFVRNMARDPVSRAMVQAIHALGQALGLATVAECVETPDVRRQLEAFGVEYVQGLDVGPPLPLSRYLGA